MMTLDERIYDAAKAQEVLENDSFLWAFESIEKELSESWKSSPARDAEGREKIYLSLQMLNKLRQALQARLETGILAKIELEHKRGLLDRTKEALRFGTF